MNRANSVEELFELWWTENRPGSVPDWKTVSACVAFGLWLRAIDAAVLDPDDLLN